MADLPETTRTAAEEQNPEQAPEEARLPAGECELENPDEVQQAASKHGEVDGETETSIKREEQEREFTWKPKRWKGAGPVEHDQAPAEVEAIDHVDESETWNNEAWVAESETWNNEVWQTEEHYDASFGGRWKSFDLMKAVRIKESSWDVLLDLKKKNLTPKKLEDGLNDTFYDSFVKEMRRVHPKKEECYYFDLDISENNMNPETCAILVRFLKLLHKAEPPVCVRSLRAYKNLLGDEGARSIGELIMCQPFPLREIHLSHNKLTGIGAGIVVLSIGVASDRYPFLANKAKQKWLACWMRLEQNQVAAPDALVAAMKAMELGGGPFRLESVEWLQRDWGPTKAPSWALSKDVAPHALLYLFNMQCLPGKEGSNTHKPVHETAAAKKAAPGEAAKAKDIVMKLRPKPDQQFSSKKATTLPPKEQQAEKQEGEGGDSKKGAKKVWMKKTKDEEEDASKVEEQSGVKSETGEKPAKQEATSNKESSEPHTTLPSKRVDTDRAAMKTALKEARREHIAAGLQASTSSWPSNQWEEHDTEWKKKWGSEGRDWWEQHEDRQGADVNSSTTAKKQVRHDDSQDLATRDTNRGAMKTALQEARREHIVAQLQNTLAWPRQQKGEQGTEEDKWKKKRSEGQDWWEPTKDKSTGAHSSGAAKKAFTSEPSSSSGRPWHDDSQEAKTGKTKTKGSEAATSTGAKGKTSVGTEWIPQLPPQPAAQVKKAPEENKQKDLGKGKEKKDNEEGKGKVEKKWKKTEKDNGKQEKPLEERMAEIISRPDESRKDKADKADEVPEQVTQKPPECSPEEPETLRPPAAVVAAKDVPAPVAAVSASSAAGPAAGPAAGSCAASASSRPAEGKAGKKVREGISGLANAWMPATVSPEKAAATTAQAPSELCEPSDVGRDGKKKKGKNKMTKTVDSDQEDQKGTIEVVLQGFAYQ